MPHATLETLKVEGGWIKTLPRNISIAKMLHVVRTTQDIVRRDTTALPKRLCTKMTIYQNEGRLLVCSKNQIVLSSLSNWIKWYYT